jgi:hypothetical protein
MRYRDIRLSESEVRRCIEWTAEKQAFKQDHEVVDQWYDRKSTSSAVDLMGRLGEIAACHALDLDWATALDWEIRPGGDTGIDCLAYGFKWDVKTSTLDELIFNSKKHFKADIAILVQLIGDRQHPEAQSSVWRVWGVCSKEKFMRDAAEHIYGEGKDERTRVKVGNEKLTPLQGFFDHITKKIWNDGEIS